MSFGSQDKQLELDANVENVQPVGHVLVKGAQRSGRVRRVIELVEVSKAYVEDYSMNTYTTATGLERPSRSRIKYARIPVSEGRQG